MPGRLEAPTFSILQLNMWGWVGFRGDPEIAHATAKSIAECRPAVVTLNEVCLAQVHTMVQDLAAAGLTYRFHHDFILQREDRMGVCEFGNALMWLGSEPMEREPDIFLPVPPGEQARKLLAVRIKTLPLDTVVCVTHLTSGSARKMGPTREKQIARIADYIRTWKEQGCEIIVAGDFNEQPDSPRLDALYLPAYGGGSRGLCHEATCSSDPSPRVRRKPFKATHDRGYKFDYIFMTEGYVPCGTKLAHSASDHSCYYGTIRPARTPEISDPVPSALGLKEPVPPR